jgi:hypothetical protein
VLVEGQTAPAQSEATSEVTTETPVLSATQQAAQDGDVSAYRAARLAERTGKPVPAPVVPLETAAKPETAQPDEPKLSKRQQDLNDRIRQATEKAVADLQAENARLKAQIPSAAPAQPHTPSPTPGTPQTLQEIVTRPDPSKALLKEAEFFAAHPTAEYSDYTQYVTRHTAAVDRAAEQSRSAQAHSHQAQKARIDGFLERVNATAKADPEFTKKLSPEVQALQPIAWMKPDQPFTVDNAIAEQLVDTGDIAPQLLLHLSQHPDSLATLRTAEGPRALAFAIGRLAGQIERAAAAGAEPQPKHVSDAPDPGTTLGRKPAVAADAVQAAVKSDNFVKFREEKRARLLASRR